MTLRKERLLTLGTPECAGHGRHSVFARPTFMAFEPDGEFLSVRLAMTARASSSMTKNGKKLMQWGEKGNQPNEKRPGYFNSVHGIAIDPERHFVFINDRNNGGKRAPRFDENGKFLDQWDMGRTPSDEYSQHLQRPEPRSARPPARDQTS